MISKRKFICRLFFLYFLMNYEAFGTSLEEAVRTALATNPSIEADEEEVKASEIDIDTARAGYFPSLDIVSSSLGKQYTSVNNKSDPPLSFQLKGHATRTITNPTVLLSQTLFDGFATIFDVERAREVANASRAVLGQTREQTAFDAVTAYVTLLAQQRLLAISIENIERHQAILEKVKKRVQGGISTIADVYQVESRLDEAIVIKKRIQGQLQVAIADFIAVVGFRPDDLDLPVLPQGPVSFGIEAILSRAAQNNPTVLVEKNKLKVAEAILDQTLSPFMPTVQAQLESNAPVRNADGVKGKQNTYTAQFVLNYNLFSGGKDVSKRAAQRERVVEAKKRVNVAMRNAEKVSRTAWGRYISAHKMAQELRDTIAVNKKLQRAYELQFALVARPLLDLLDAYVSYFRSQTDYVNAQADKDINHALLLASMGELVCSFQ